MQREFSTADGEGELEGDSDEEGLRDVELDGDKLTEKLGERLTLEEFVSEGLNEADIEGLSEILEEGDALAEGDELILLDGETDEEALEASPL